MADSQPVDRRYALETRGLLKMFGGVKALNELTMAVRREGMTGIIGPNGSGKSTLINLLTGLLPFEGGVVIVDGVACKAIPPHQASSYGLTRTYQEVRLINQISVLDNILLTLTSRRLFVALLERDNDHRREEARQILESVGLWDKWDRPAADLSFGQRKLLEIARALAMNVQIYLFDEPFDGIHVRMLEIVRSLLKQLKEDGRTILFVSHNMDLIRELSDEVIVINSGSLVAQGTHQEVLARQDVIESYLGT